MRTNNFTVVSIFNYILQQVILPGMKAFIVTSETLT